MTGEMRGASIHQWLIYMVPLLLAIFTATYYLGAQMGELSSRVKELETNRQEVAVALDRQSQTNERVSQVLGELSAAIDRLPRDGRRR